MKLDTVVCGNCLDVLPTIPDQSVDAVITDPPYPCIKRDYGYWTVEEWWELIVEGVIPEVRRILKPTGSAVFILQPNSEHVGQMRGWLWEFMAWACREWNMVQDVWWWNITAIPTGLCAPRERGLLRASLKACVWMGSPTCFRTQDAVLWDESLSNARERARGRFQREELPSGQGINRASCAQTAIDRGGVTPFNVLPIPNANSQTSAGAYGHGAGTPLALADWWTRYIVPPDGVSVDLFVGTGTMPVAAVKNRCHFFGCDTVQDYVDIANERIAKARLKMAQMELAL